MFHRVNLKDYLLKVLSHLILGKGPTQGLEHTLTAEKMYSINFMVTKKKFCISLHYNRANSYLFDYGREIFKFRAKDPEIIAVPLCLGNIPKDWSADNIKKKGFNGYVYDFSVEYDATDVDDNVDIHRYLKKKRHSVIKCVDLLKKCFFFSINNFIKLHKRKFVDLYFNEQTRV